MFLLQMKRNSGKKSSLDFHLFLGKVENVYLYGQHGTFLYECLPSRHADNVTDNADNATASTTKPSVFKDFCSKSMLCLQGYRIWCHAW